MTNEWQSIRRYLENVENDLRNSAPNASGNLRSSISASIDQTSNSDFTIAVSMLDYGIYQDQGVNGTEQNWGSPFSYRDKMPPASAFSQYTSDPGEQYAIAKSIYRKGIQPRNFINPTLDRHMEDLANFAAEDLWDWFYQQNK